MAASIVSLRNVEKWYGNNHVVKDMNLEIEEGEFLTLLGPSGCGKTTTLRMIAGFEDATEGSIEVQGVRVEEKEPFQRDVNTVFQNYSLFPHMTVYDNVAYGPTIRKVPKDEIRRRVTEMLELVQMADYEKRKPEALSGGQKQRIAIARALATDPKVLLCDEATSALDPNTTHAILELIRKINKELGITVVIITHQMSVVEEVCNRVAILDNGTVVEEGEVQAIFSHPSSAAAKRLVYPAGAPKAENLPGHKLVRVAFGGTQTTDKPLVASLAIECGALVSIMGADTRIVNGQTLGSMLLALPEDEHAEAALEYIKNYPGITYEEVNN